tara:strand:- start:1090 stop:4452 length:3363 start_codon:yes stop_codon:yes gene_type:complete
MKLIQNFIKTYINRKLKYQTINTLISFLVVLISFFIILIFIEINAYLNPIIKQKIFSLIYSIIFVFIIFLLLRFYIHKHNIFNNSNYSKVAIELIEKIPTKDRIINALQIYSKYDSKDSYSDLTINAINQLENELKNINVYNISLSIYKKNIYALTILFVIFIAILNFNNFYNAYYRLFNKNKEFHRNIPFSLNLFQAETNNYFYKGDNVKIIVNSKGDSPDKIEFYIKSKNMSKKIDKYKTKQTYELNLNNINEETKVWARYNHESFFPFNKYSLLTDTFYIKIKKRPEIKRLDLIVNPPKYLNIDKINHNPSMKKIEAVEGSKLSIKAIYDKNIKNGYISFNKDSVVNIQSNINEIDTEININSSFDIEIKCTDHDNYESIPINYKVIKINDMAPQAFIKFPKDDFNLKDNMYIPLEVEVFDDFGISFINLKYNINKPYYLIQDTLTYEIPIKKVNELNKKNMNFTYNWKVKNLNLSPGDELIYWITAYDNKENEHNIGLSNKFRAYLPALEELYFEVEEEQEVIEQNFDDMLNSVDELKSMYDDISKDILKEQAGFEQSQEIASMNEELQQISEKIKNLESTIETIEDLNNKNNLINEHLGEKIEKLQNIFQDMLNSDLTKLLDELQNSINEDDFKKSLEQLNNLDFEIDDLESQLDRMINLFEQIVAEQKLNELIKKIDKMSEFQDKISETINQNHNEKNIDPMLNKQKDNLSDFEEKLQQAMDLTQNLDSVTTNKIKNLTDSLQLNTMNDLLEKISNHKNKDSMIENSNKVEKKLDSVKNELNKIIEQYQKKSTLEMLNLFSRIIKNLIDMSYEQEQLMILSMNLKSKKDTMIFNIAKKENILMQQYKSVFLQISDLSNKSFHISTKTSKTFSQIFVYLSKTIAGLEQGKISDSKKNQLKTMTYINETILQLISAMDDMQGSGEASGYSQYLESMEQLMAGQQQINQGMNSLIPMPFGQQQNGNGLMESLMQKQQQLKNQLEQLMDENSTSSTNNQGDGLGKALDDIDKIIEDFKKNKITQESIDRGKQVYRRLLEHKNALQNRGYDDKWEATENIKNEWNKTNIIDQANSKNKELNKLYKSLDDIDKNQNISNENKKIIQEYLKILINEKIDEK